MGFEEYFQPPFSVFFLWAIFLGIIVLFHPIKTVVRKLCQRLGCSWCAAEEIEVNVGDRGGDGDRHGDYYGHLSAERKLEIDNLRTVAILKYLAEFTLTLKDENMTSIESSERVVTVESVHEVPCEANETDVVSSEYDQPEDIEKGFPNEEEIGIKVHEEAQLEVLECSGEHTHVLVPLPGQSNTGEREVNLDNPEPVVNSTWQNFRVHQHNFKSSVLKSKSPQDKPSSNETAVEDQNTVESKIIERPVPIFCAVCLMEYEVSDRVCWSSNRACTHVFHEDCIVQWLVSSGRTKSKRRWFPENPSEKRLMCYELECPCCRQEFISNKAKAESTEENV